jgi:LmbE family N-acetylglucosaminyl deacetylase
VTHSFPTRRSSDCVVLVRVTNDATDSDGLDRATTVDRNRRELEEAAELLGVSEIVDLGYESDTLADCSEQELRERLIWNIRMYRPYGMVTFDPFSGPGEDNLDHLRVAQAADEAFWTSMFDKHHPEHLAEGLAPHGIFERWYFARNLREATAVVDITPVVSTKVDAVAAHKTMVGNMVRQALLQADTGSVAGGIRDILTPDDVRPFADRLVRYRSSVAGRRHGLPFAEEYRRVIFSDLDQVLG